MSRSLLYKLGTTIALIFVLVLVLGRIGNIVEERQRLQHAVVEDIARSSTGSQQLTGPLMVVPFVRTITEWRETYKTGKRYQETIEVPGQLHFLPQTFVLNGELTLEPRYRGIYEARLYHADNRITGRFELPANFGITEAVETYRFEEPYLAVGISDIRGIENDLVANVNGGDVRFLPGTRLKLLGTGVHAPLKVSQSNEAQRVEFTFKLRLQGMESLQVTPVGRETSVELTSTWPHPSFIGDYLPVERTIDTKGFRARWQTSFFATNLEETLQGCSADMLCSALEERRFGVGLIDPVDQYLKSERAIKYAMLFIGLTFAAFFLFEVLKRLSVHPVQYGLVGVALAIFYLLLLSLSEHVGFELAYLVSAAACVLLIGFYVGHVLHSHKRGGLFGAGLALMYGLLYGLLRSEDYSLLMGSLFVFALLAGVMVITRKVDWFHLGNRAPAG